MLFVLRLWRNMSASTTVWTTDGLLLAFGQQWDSICLLATFFFQINIPITHPDKVKVLTTPVSTGTPVSSVWSSEEASDPPHVDRKQGKLLRQKTNTLLQMTQEGHQLRARLQPAPRHLRLLQQLLHDKEQVAWVLVPVNREPVEPRAHLHLQREHLLFVWID